MKKIMLILVGTLLIVFLLFEVRIDFQFALPAEVAGRDDEQERRYEQCVESRDREIHRVAFGTIDNPDVQREYLSTHKDRAKIDCRREFPVVENVTHEPFRFKLLELRYRFAK
jgi:hypothetical protein